MTKREFKIELALCDRNNLFSGDIIDKLFDDFESRTCENCKYSDVPFDFRRSYACHLLKGFFEIDFGCNKFERREING